MKTRKIRTPSFLRKQSPKSVPLNSLRSLGSVKSTIPTASTVKTRTNNNMGTTLPRSQYQMRSRVFSPVSPRVKDSSEDIEGIFDLESVKPSLSQKRMTPSSMRLDIEEDQKNSMKTPKVSPLSTDSESDSEDDDIIEGVPQKQESPVEEEPQQPQEPQQSQQSQEPDLLTQTSQNVMNQVQQGTSALTQNVRSIVEQNNPPNAAQMAPIDHIAHHFRNFVVKPGRRQLRGVVGRTKNLLGNLENVLTSPTIPSIGGRKLRKARKTRKLPKKNNKGKAIHMNLKNPKKSRKLRKAHKTRKALKNKARKTRKH